MIICLFVYFSLNCVKTKKEETDWINTEKEIRVVWRNFSTLERRNKLKLDKRRTILHHTRYIIIFDFFYADHSILKPGIATQHNILNLILAAIQQALKASLGAATLIGHEYNIGNNEIQTMKLHKMLY